MLGRHRAPRQMRTARGSSKVTTNMGKEVTKGAEATHELLLDVEEEFEEDLREMNARQEADMEAGVATMKRADVLVLEKAPEAEKDGNYYFTAGGFRFVHAGLEDVCGDVLVYLSEQSVRRPICRPTTAPISRNSSCE